MAMVGRQSCRLFRVGLEIQSTPVRAVTKSRGPGAIVKDMAQMAAAPGAMEFGAHHAVAAVGAGLHRPRLGIPETGPAGAAVEFRRGVEQFGAAAGAFEFAMALFMVQRTGTRPLGAVLDQHAMLFGGEGAGHFGIAHEVSFPASYSSGIATSYWPRFLPIGGSPQ